MKRFPEQRRTPRALYADGGRRREGHKRPEGGRPPEGGRRRNGLLCIGLLVSLMGTNAWAAPAPCQARLTIELTPDVPNPTDVGFLSSLLSNKVRYQLTLRRERSDSLLDVDLSGPGPAYRCQNVIETIRKDGRVRSVQSTAGS